MALSKIDASNYYRVRYKRERCFCYLPPSTLKHNFLSKLHIYALYVRSIFSTFVLFTIH